MSSQLKDSHLFKPITIGDGIHLKHRVVHAPTSRSRSTCDGENFPTDLMLDYYDSRSKEEGTFLVFESCLVSPRSGLVPYKSGTWSVQQCQALKKITDKIHNNKSFVSCQIFAPGRVSNIQVLKEKGILYLAPSVIYHSQAQEDEAKQLEYPLQELGIDQIKQIQDDFVDAAVNCLEIANFDLVELHGSSGFLIEQFLSPTSNKRNDQYGGSIENRCRFLIEIIEKLVEKVGSSKIGIRLSAWSKHFGMNYSDLMDEKFPPLVFCQYILDYLENLKQQGKEIAYVSLAEPRVSGSSDQDPLDNTNDSLISKWSGILIRAGGYATNYKSAINSASPPWQLKKDVDQDNRTLIAFSRPFTSNPDLVNRLRNNLKLDLYERKFFYTHQLEGYLTFGDYVNDKVGSNTLPIPSNERQREGVSLA
ncbi:hypothetical protein KGF56_002744 [Candida oxycetoniae]|uniref:NADH:flavin oxidoreductase/NADH oxidase N-terminal domain-containing protein n=1 Tax=Candida oxycetoniae TaxID=497107 RepID=A0AAI9SXA9_9ASCO|nr:uncharacterized protein KGF56_002744 [Candida oxycetoniae]KAI3404447.2 hypothetical protein KGF56_002744 [Candida oxycetoniae]